MNMDLNKFIQRIRIQSISTGVLLLPIMCNKLVSRARAKKLIWQMRQFHFHSHASSVYTLLLVAILKL